jgi:hypothetical protein
MNVCGDRAAQKNSDWGFTDIFVALKRMLVSRKEYQ